MTLTLTFLHDTCPAPTRDPAGHLVYPAFVQTYIDEFLHYFQCPNCRERISVYVRRPE